MFDEFALSPHFATFQEDNDVGKHDGQVGDFRSNGTSSISKSDLPSQITSFANKYSTL